MSIVRYSTGYRNFRLGRGSLQQALQNGQIEGYSGTMPASADNAPGTTKLITFTTGSAARTAEVCGYGTVTLTGGAAGTVDSITVNSVQMLSPDQFTAAVPVAYNTSLTQTAADVATQINKGTWWHKILATSSGAIITLTYLPGYGDSVNTHVVACSSTTITNSTANVANGVDPANGLKYGTTASGAITKGGDAWSGVGIADGTIGWVRMKGSVADADGSSTTAIRVDMDAATAAAFFQMSSTVAAVGATITISSGTFTEQATVSA